MSSLPNPLPVLLVTVLSLVASLPSVSAQPPTLQDILVPSALVYSHYVHHTEDSPEHNGNNTNTNPSGGWERRDPDNSVQWIDTQPQFGLTDPLDIPTALSDGRDVFTSNPITLLDPNAEKQWVAIVFAVDEYSTGHPPTIAADVALKGQASSHMYRVIYGINGVASDPIRVNSDSQSLSNADTSKIDSTVWGPIGRDEDYPIYASFNSTSPNYQSGHVWVKTDAAAQWAIYRLASDMGLLPGDVIDALCVDPTTGGILFSITPTSPSISTVYPVVTGAHIYGSFPEPGVTPIRVTWAKPEDLGLDPAGSNVTAAKVIDPVVYAKNHPDLDTKPNASESSENYDGMYVKREVGFAYRETGGFAGQLFLKTSESPTVHLDKLPSENADAMIVATILAIPGFPDPADSNSFMSGGLLCTVGLGLNPYALIGNDPTAAPWVLTTTPDVSYQFLTPPPFATTWTLQGVYELERTSGERYWRSSNMITMHWR